MGGWVLHVRETGGRDSTRKRTGPPRRHRVVVLIVVVLLAFLLGAPGATLTSPARHAGPSAALSARGAAPAFPSPAARTSGLLGQWTALTADLPFSPVGRSGAAAAYDPTHHEVVVFGGRTATSLLGDTWTWDGSQWVNRTPPISIIGQNSPNPRYGGGLAYDAAVQGMVLFSGHGASGLLNGTWIFHDHSWTPWTTTGPSPSVRAEVSLVGDPATTGAILFGGRGSNSALNDTWRFDSTGWTNLTATSGSAPPPRRAAAAAYDTLLGGVVVFGGYASSGLVNDTWLFANGSWSRLPLGNSPTPRASSGMTFDPLDGGLLLLGGQGTPLARLSDLWALNGTNWTSVSTSGAPSGRTGAAFVYLPANGSALQGESLMFGGATNVLSTASETWLYGSRLPLSVIQPGPSVTELDPGASVTFVTFAYGGSGTGYQYTWSGLPTECPSVDLPTLSCTVPNLVSDLIVWVLVVDSSGSSMISPTTTVTINSPPQITTFLVRSSPIGLGQNVTFVVNATGGTGALRFSFSGLPPGCFSANATSITCTPRSAGTFLVSVNVSDGFGSSAVASNSLVVKATLSATTTPWLLYAGLGMVGVALVGLVALAAYRSKPVQPKTVTTSGPKPTVPSPPPGGSPPKAS